MSRSYMTLLAAAAAEETAKGRRQQVGALVLVLWLLLMLLLRFVNLRPGISQFVGWCLLLTKSEYVIPHSRPSCDFLLVFIWVMYNVCSRDCFKSLEGNSPITRRFAAWWSALGCCNQGKGTATLRLPPSRLFQRPVPFMSRYVTSPCVPSFPPPQGVGGPGRGTGEVSTTEQAFQPLTVEGKLRQLEAENLRLRFRVADLEGQVRIGALSRVFIHSLPAFEGGLLGEGWTDGTPWNRLYSGRH